MKGSLRIAQVGGIPIRIHWTFPFLLVLVVFAYGGQGATALADGFIWIVAIFASVTVHELSHCLVARRRGLIVRDIVLLPIGGVSEIPGVESGPDDELTVAAAGPAASFGLAAVLAVVALVTRQAAWPPTLFAGSWVTRLLWANVLLGAFNLLPALPMDGGRVLQAVLVRKRGELPGTALAVQAARLLAIAMVVGGLFYNLWITLIGLFVLLAAGQELRQAVARSSLAGYQVREFMTPQAPVQGVVTVGHLGADPSLGRLQTWVVVDGRRYLGLVTREDLPTADPARRLATLADPAPPLLDEGTDVYPAALAAFDRSDRRVLGVARDGTVTGLLRSADIATTAGRVPSRPTGS